jgi:hypothetical protein
MSQYLRATAQGHLIHAHSLVVNISDSAGCANWGPAPTAFQLIPPPKVFDFEYKDGLSGVEAGTLSAILQAPSIPNSHVRPNSVTKALEALMNSPDQETRRPIDSSTDV